MGYPGKSTIPDLNFVVIFIFVLLPKFLSRFRQLKRNTGNSLSTKGIQLIFFGVGVKLI